MINSAERGFPAKEDVEKREERERLELRNMESVLALASYWKDKLIRNKALALRQKSAFLHHLKILQDGETSLSLRAADDVRGLVDTVEQEFRANESDSHAWKDEDSLREALKPGYFFSERAERWSTLEGPEYFLKQAPEEMKRFDLLFGRVSKCAEERDSKKLHESLIPFDDRFADHVGMLPAIGIALERCWARDIPNQPVPGDFREVWQTLADGYIRLHSQLYLPSANVVKDPNWEQLSVVLSAVRTVFYRAQGTLKEYEQQKKRVGAGRKAAARRGRVGTTNF